MNCCMEGRGRTGVSVRHVMELQQQVSGGLRQSGKGANHLPVPRLSETGPASRMRETGISSGFELRLGQASQQTQSAGKLFPSMATSSVEHPKSHLFEQIMSKVWDGKLQHSLQQFNPVNQAKFSTIPGQASDQESARQPVHGSSPERLENLGVERRGEERDSAAIPTPSKPNTQHLSHNVSQPGNGAEIAPEQITALEFLQNQSESMNKSTDHQSGREPTRLGTGAAKSFPRTAEGPLGSVMLENGATLDSLCSEALAQLSKRTGQRLLETAIQSSFSYRAIGLESPAAFAPKLNNIMPCACRGEGRLFGQLDVYGRSTCGSRQGPSFLESLVRNQLRQQDSELSRELAFASSNGARVEQNPNHCAFQMLDQLGSTLINQQHSVQRLRVEECGPEAEHVANLGLESSKVQNDLVIPSRLSQDGGEGEVEQGKRMDLQHLRSADLAGKDPRGSRTDTVTGEDVQCRCLNCRKASPSARGQAVARFAGQVCLKERASLVSSMEAERKVVLAEGEHHGMKHPSQVEQPDLDGRDGVEDHCKVVESPSSLGCPSFSDVVGKRGKKRGEGGSDGRSVMEVDNEVEGNEPVTGTGKLERKQRRTMKWKWLVSGGSNSGDRKESSSPGESSLGRPEEPQLLSEDARMRSKNVEEVATRRGALKRDLVRAWSGEMVASSKRRKLMVPRRHQETKATNVTEENLEAARRSFGEHSSTKAGTTLVIRVPQGVSRQKAKKGTWMKLQQQQSNYGTRDLNAVAREERCAVGGDGRGGLELGKTTPSRPAGPPMKDSMGRCGSGSGDAGGSGLISLPNSVKFSIRSPRTPFSGRSPRNGRMVPLSVILNQPAAASPVPGTVEKLRDGVANSFSRREDTTIHKGPEAHVGNDNVTGGRVKVSKPDLVGSSHDTGIAREDTEDTRTRLVQWKDYTQSQKVRSMLELTGKDLVHGPGASSVFEFAEEEYHVAVARKATTKQQVAATVSAAVQTDSPLRGAGAGPLRLGTKSCPFPRGERSARSGGPIKKKVEVHRRGDSQSEGPCKRAFEKGRTYVCKVAQVSSTAGSTISREKLQQGFDGPAFPIRKQVRSSMAKRSSAAMVDGAQAKDRRVPPAETVRIEENRKVRQMQHGQGQGQLKGGITGNGVLKRRLEFPVPGVSVKRSRVVLALKKVKEGVMGKIKGPTDSSENWKSQRGSLKGQKKTEGSSEDPLVGRDKLQRREKSQTLDVNGRSFTMRKGRAGVGVQGNQSSQDEKCRCDVCGTFNSGSYNKMLCCSRCMVKVHQACYGVPKIPKGPWMCRICKFKVTNPICVLCGYGGGAMTRVQKARPLCQTLLQAWRELKNGNACASVPVPVPVPENDDDETLLSASHSIQLSRARLAGERAGTNAKKRECESCDCKEPRVEGSACKACGQENPEGGSGNDVKVSERGRDASWRREDWRRSNTVGSIVRDGAAKQWAHMVCTLWMPGTRCLNMGTMGVFDVSGVTASRRKALCSICQRKGGACIQCRVPKCGTPFHVWCAHDKGLLQSEIVQHGSNKVGFFGKCLRHGISRGGVEWENFMKEDACLRGGGSCARTEGYKGRLSLEEQAMAQQRMHLEGATAITAEQVAEWLRISDRKMTARRVLKPTNPAMKFDHREYLRFKQKKGWRKLAVCKSGIHALGLYTTNFIGEGEVVVEYVGEIVGLRVADKREAEYHSGKRLQYQGACYLFRIDSEQIIDATHKGGIARFVNHSCSPNCVAKVICVDNLKKVIFFAKRDIYAGEEVTYDYKFNYDEVGDKIPCFCGTPECRGTLN